MPFASRVMKTCVDRLLFLVGLLYVPAVASAEPASVRFLSGLQGLGFIGRLRTRLRDSNVHLGAECELQLLRSLSGSLHQEFYDDDPYSEGNESGLTVDSDFSTKSVALQARVGLEFPF